MLERHAAVPDLREHWRGLFAITDGYVQHRIGCVVPHQLERLDAVIEWTRSLGPLSTGIEVGCCEGMMTIRLAECFDDLLAVDFLAEFFPICPDLPNIRYEEHDVNEWTPEGRVDLVLMCEVLEHLPNPVDVLRRFAPHTERILATCPINEALTHETWDLDLLRERALPAQLDGLSVGAAAGHVWAMDMNGFRLMFEEAGLVVEREGTVGPNGIILTHA